MIKLFIDTTGDYLVTLVLTPSNEILSYHKILLKKQYTEKTISLVTNDLWEQGCKLSDIEELYLINGPGYYTGTRVGVLFSKTLYLLNSQIKIYTMNTLAFQAGLSPAISIVNATKNSVFVAVYEKGEVIIPPQLIPRDLLSDVVAPFIEQKFLMLKNYEQLNYQQQFHALQSRFSEINDPDQLTPMYINPIT